MTEVTGRLAYYDGCLSPKIVALSEIALFGALSETELQGLADRTVERRFAADEMLFWEGEAWRQRKKRIGRWIQTVYVPAHIRSIDAASNSEIRDVTLPAARTKVQPVGRGNRRHDIQLVNAGKAGR